MPTVVFWSLFWSSTVQEVGRAVLVNGQVAFTGEMAPGGIARERIGFDTTKVFDSDGMVLTPADGERYLHALPRTFHGSYFWARRLD